MPGVGTRLRLVLGEDNADIVWEIRNLLSPDFDVVATAENGVCLVAAAERLKPDIIVTDINMPGMNGIEAGRRIRALGYCEAIVILSATNDPEIVQATLEAGICGYVLKENAGEELASAIESAVKGRPFLSSGILSRTVPSPVFSRSFKK